MSSASTVSYRLGVDVGGTFTDLLLINESSGETYSAKVPSTPADSSVGVLNGINKLCDQNRIDPSRITHVMHGTTVATNTVLEGKGARVGLVTTQGYRQVLQIARSCVPGGLPEADEAAQFLLDEAQSQGGRLLAISVHPWVLGQPHRIKHLESVLAQLARHGSIWNAQPGEILAAFVAQQAQSQPQQA